MKDEEGEGRRWMQEGGRGYGMAWQIKEEREEGDKKGKKRGGWMQERGEGR